MALTPEQIQSLAQAILTLRAHSQAPADDAGVTFPTIDLTEAYAIQSAIEKILEKERGWTRIGYKVGATNAPSRQKMHLDKPFYGRLYKELSSESGAEVKFTPHFSQMIEVEIAVEIAEDLPKRARPYNAVDLKAAASAVAPAFEFVGSVFPAAGPLTPPNLVADFGGLAHWVVGKKITDFQKLDLLEVTTAVSVNGEHKADGKGANVDGGPFASAAFIANEMADAGAPLRAGDLITTGTIINPLKPDLGMDIEADFGPLGVVRAFMK